MTSKFPFFLATCVTCARCTTTRTTPRSPTRRH
nr:MAG TPA_asm: hypothetical protein [Caudoviricetes sp.]